MNTTKIILFVIASILTGYCQAQFADNFSDGDFISNPAWSGDNSKFAINTGKLKLQGLAVSESAFLSIPSQAIHLAGWEFYLQMDFNPSATNYAKIYLVSDQPNLNQALNGYYIKAGNTSRDVCLYRQNGTTEVRIIDGADDRVNVSQVKIKIKVTRSDTGLWQLFSDVGPTGSYSLEGTFTDNTNTISSYFGVQCVYTATRSDKFWFDDFIVSGVPVPDTTPPDVLSVKTLNAKQLNIFFSERLDASASNVENVLLKTIGSPESIVLSSDRKSIQLNFFTSLTNGVTYSLRISNIKDLVGNVMAGKDFDCLYFQASPSQYKDIIFTELFADVSPQIGLPNAEFAEIYNRSSVPFNLSGWKITDGSSTGIFPSAIILPGEYWIITATSSSSLYSSYGKTLGLINFPTLNNSGDSFILKNPDGITIDSVYYNLDSYRDADKQQGGWTLELIDPNNPCGEQDNWTASDDVSGGTPGRKNDVFSSKPDVSPPFLLTVFPESPTRLALTFNEKLDVRSLAPDNFLLQPTRIVGDAIFKDIGHRTILLNLRDELSLREKYSIEMKSVTDCNLNVSERSVFSFGVPEAADSLDVKINEILFNPRSGGVDFVEVFNASKKYLNLKNWKVGNYKEGIVVNSILLFADNVLLAPESFAVFTTNPSIVKLQYNSSVEGNFYKTSLPGLSDDEGSVAIIADNRVIDEVNYSKSWHSVFIKDDEGVSLERISLKAPSNDPVNWTSASASVGFATPGFANSQGRINSDMSNDDVSIVPDIFSPDNGTGEFVQIHYHFDRSPVANIKVYDPQGHLLRTIASNETLGSEGFFRWEGDRDDGTKARTGYYIVWFEIFDPSGFTRIFRKRVIVSSR